MTVDDSVAISVVVPVRQAVATAQDTLTRLLDRATLEVIAVVASGDPTAAILRSLKARRPELRLIELDGAFSAPQLRAHGIRAAQGRLVAITEDHCDFSRAWPEALATALEDPRIGASGGAVVNGRSGTLLDWAIYFSRYALLMPPIPRREVALLAGNNACYRRDLLEAHRELYRDGFWEHDFHQQLTRCGFALLHEPEAWVVHRKPYRFGAYCALRFRHGRCFGAMIRDRAAAGARSRARFFFAPLTPFLLAFRAARAVAAKRTHRTEFLLALPLLMIFYSAWTAGEAAGYLRGSGQACSQTD